MSRIYEALRRAEAERAAAEASLDAASVEAEASAPVAPAAPAAWDGPAATLPVPPVPSVPSGPTVQAGHLAARWNNGPGISRPEAGYRDGHAEAGRADAAFSPVHTLSAAGALPAAGAPPAVNTVDLESIPSAVWTPSLKQLPAVQERGRTVEQFRSLRSRMQEYRGANRLKSILVTSGLPQEGKSFVAVNLAVSLARHKISSVLLIDGDMRRSSLHKVLGCPNDGPGLTEYLSGEARLEQIMQRPAPDPSGAPLPLGFSSLIFIGAGREADKAADLSGNHRFEELIATVAPLFDWVIVDSSPVNLVADGVNLARACDGVLLIARGAVTKFETAQQAVAALEASKILGFVLNAVNSDFASNGYYDYDSTAEQG